MTIRNVITGRLLLKWLKECDDDVLEYEIGILTRIEISKYFVLNSRSFITELPRHVDVEHKTIILKTEAK